MSIKIGDRVRVNDNYPCDSIPSDHDLSARGATGIVTSIPDEDLRTNYYRVTLDEASHWHLTYDASFHAVELDLVYSRDARIEELEGNNAAYRIILEKFLDSQREQNARIKVLEDALGDIVSYAAIEPTNLWAPSVAACQKLAQWALDGAS
jgi:hypothetical protein